MADNTALSEAQRDILRKYHALVYSGAEPGVRWRRAVREAMGFLGGQADRHTSTLWEYNHDLNGPFLGISDEGGAAEAIRHAAFASPKARALGHKKSPLSIGVGLDAERLGSIGEVPVGIEEFAGIWSDCSGRMLMTTNVGSRANVRLYGRVPLVTIPSGHKEHALSVTKEALVGAFKPFLQAPGGPRPIVILLEFEFGSIPSAQEQVAMLRTLVEYVKNGCNGETRIVAPRIHLIGLNVRIGWGQKGCEDVLTAIDVASAAGVEHVSVDGVVRKDADAKVSLPGLLDYLPPELVTKVLDHAHAKKVHIRTINVVDADTIAREIWAALNTARGMGLDLGKYGLFPLSLEECDAVVGQVQRWFPDWTAAPVFYVDQGIISRTRVYVGRDTAQGVEDWLRIVAKHKVRIVLIDTVDKAKGWKILKVNDDPKGILNPEELARLNAFGQQLGIKMLWAGGITVEHAYEFGKLGVFGIYVTTAASEAAPVTGDYRQDTDLAAAKRPTFDGVLKVKTMLEAGFLLASLDHESPQVPAHKSLLAEIKQAGGDLEALARILPRAWRAWWQRKDSKGRGRHRGKK